MAKRKDPAAVALGRRGGKNSRKYLKPEQTTVLPRKAAAARWGDRESETTTVEDEARGNV